ncbi:MAG TPA: PIG-L family deacetylase [Gammaproteobacteria bacterium]|jgi:LmbE family N-acetylglucosaminyl deacetylase
MTTHRVLVLLAHHDDEFFLAPLIQDECRAGAELMVVYLTHGSALGVEAQARIAESDRVLSTLGVAPRCMSQLGAELGISDGGLMDAARRACATLTERFPPTQFRRAYLMAWEGGHTDHDTAHMIGAAWARQAAVELLEFPLYNACGRAPGKFTSMRLTPRAGRIHSRPVDEAEAKVWRDLSASYPSQRQVFASLMPGIERALFKRRSCEYRELTPLPDYSQRPHEGPLFYEQRFALSFETFRDKLTVLRTA